jgi:glycosyltransferase involved in cell wall biosynthesis
MIISIIVPVYNEEKTILASLTKLNKLVFKEFKKEIIVVDDGSNDETNKLLSLNKNLFTKVLTKEKNEGKGSAIKLGIENSVGSHIVFHDSDLEYDPQDLLKFEEVFLNFKADAVLGSRFNYDRYTRSHNILNKIGNFFITTFFNILYNTTFTDIYSCYFAFKKDLLDVKNLKIMGFGQHAEIICHVIKKGSNFYEVPINYNGRSISEGKKIRFYDFFSVVYVILFNRIK